MTNATDRQSLLRRGRLLEYFTIGYNLLEGVIAVGSGLIAGSIALVGFGIDSGIEVISGSALLWRLSSRRDAAAAEHAEKTALRVVGISFLLLAAWVAYDAIVSIYRREVPDQSTVGIILAAVSLVVMPLLARSKRRVARAIGSRALEADSTQTELCTWLSAILLGGLLLNALAGWWWADPVAALIMVPIIAKEGLGALRGEECGCHDSCSADEPSE